MLKEIKIEEVNPGDVVVLEAPMYHRRIYFGLVVANDIEMIKIEVYEGYYHFYHKSITHIYKQVEG